MIGSMDVLALAPGCACSAGDDTADGTRATCAEGGALNDCPRRRRTPRGRVLAARRLRRDPARPGRDNASTGSAASTAIERLTADRAAPRDRLHRGVDVRRAQVDGSPELDTTRCTACCSGTTDARSHRRSRSSRSRRALGARTARRRARLDQADREPAGRHGSARRGRRSVATPRASSPQSKDKQRDPRADQARRDRDVRHHRRDRDRGPRQPRRSERGADAAEDRRRSGARPHQTRPREEGAREARRAATTAARDTAADAARPTPAAGTTTTGHDRPRRTARHRRPTTPTGDAPRRRAHGRHRSGSLLGTAKPTTERAGAARARRRHARGVRAR